MLVVNFWLKSGVVRMKEKTVDRGVITLGSRLSVEEKENQETDLKM